MDGWGRGRSSGLSHPELLQEPVRFAPVDAHPGHGLAHRTASPVPDPRAPGVDAGAPGPDAHGAVHGARARTRRGARVVELSDAVDEAVVIDAPLAPVVPELVVQVALGRVLRRRALRAAPGAAPGSARQRQQHQDQRDGEAAPPHCGVVPPPTVFAPVPPERARRVDLSARSLGPLGGSKLTCKQTGNSPPNGEPGGSSDC